MGWQTRETCHRRLGSLEKGLEILCRPAASQRPRRRDARTLAAIAGALSSVFHISFSFSTSSAWMVISSRGVWHGETQTWGVHSCRPPFYLSRLALRRDWAKSSRLPRSFFEAKTLTGLPLQKQTPIFVQYFSTGRKHWHLTERPFSLHITGQLRVGREKNIYIYLNTFILI